MQEASSKACDFSSRLPKCIPLGSALPLLFSPILSLASCCFRFLLATFLPSSVRLLFPSLLSSRLASSFQRHLPSLRNHLPPTIVGLVHALPLNLCIPFTYVFPTSASFCSLLSSFGFFLLPLASSFLFPLAFFFRLLLSLSACFLIWLSNRALYFACSCSWLASFFCFSCLLSCLLFFFYLLLSLASCAFLLATFLLATFLLLRLDFFSSASLLLRHDTCLNPNLLAVAACFLLRALAANLIILRYLV